MTLNQELAKICLSHVKKKKKKKKKKQENNSLRDLKYAISLFYTNHIPHFFTAINWTFFTIKCIYVNYLEKKYAAINLRSFSFCKISSKT